MGQRRLQCIADIVDCAYRAPECPRRVGEFCGWLCSRRGWSTGDDLGEAVSLECVQHRRSVASRKEPKDERPPPRADKVVVYGAGERSSRVWVMGTIEDDRRPRSNRFQTRWHADITEG